MAPSKEFPSTCSKSWSLYNLVYHEEGSVSDHILEEITCVYVGLMNKQRFVLPLLVPYSNIKVDRNTNSAGIFSKYSYFLYVERTHPFNLVLDIL